MPIIDVGNLVNEAENLGSEIKGGISRAAAAVTPEDALPYLESAKKYLVDPFNYAAEQGAEVGSETAKDVVSSLGSEPLATLGGVVRQKFGLPPTLGESEKISKGVSEFQGEHPVITGVAGGLGAAAGGTVADPRMWLLGLGDTELETAKSLMGKGFTIQQVHSAVSSIPQVAQALKSGDVEGATEALTQGVTNLGLAGLGALHSTGASETFDKSIANGENRLVSAANEYQKENGLQPLQSTKGIALDKELAKRTADFYDSAKHEPNAPAVQQAYKSLQNDVAKQWDFATQKMGIKFEPWDKPGQPYANSAQMMQDVADNKHLYFFRGGLPSETDHPMAAVDPNTGYSYTEMLRAVHDLFGHAMEGNQFGPVGERRAFFDHAQMMSPDSVPAMAFETHGQNSWVNFGEHLRDEAGNVPEKGQSGYVEPAKRPYAEQKANILPPELYRAKLAETAVALPQAEAERLGIEYRGNVAGIPGEHPGLAIFQDPQSGTSIGVPLDDLTPQRIEQHLTDARNRMFRSKRAADLMQSREAGAIDTASGQEAPVPEGHAGLEIAPEFRQPLDHAPTEQDIKNYTARHRAFLEQNPDVRVGWDNNSHEPGGHELNLGAVGPKENALKVAKKLDQVGAWDGKKVLPVGGTGLQREFPEYPLEQRLQELRGKPEEHTIVSNAKVGTIAEGARTADAAIALTELAKRYKYTDVSKDQLHNPSFLLPNGKVIDLGQTWHPAAIAALPYEARSAWTTEAQREGSEDTRIQFLNDTGAIRIRPQSNRAGDTLHFSVPKRGVTEAQAEGMRKLAGMLHYGNIYVETAEKPSDSKIAVKEFANPVKVDEALKEIGAAPQIVGVKQSQKIPQEVIGSFKHNDKKYSVIRVPKGDISSEDVEKGRGFILSDGSWSGVLKAPWGIEHGEVELHIPRGMSPIRIAAPNSFDIASDKPTESQMQEMSRIARDYGSHEIFWDIYPSDKPVESGSGSFVDFRKSINDVFGNEITKTSKAALPIPVALKGNANIPDESIQGHEYGHGAQAIITGGNLVELRSAWHPESMATGAAAAAKISVPAYGADTMDEWVRDPRNAMTALQQSLAGPVTQQIVYGIPIRENPGIAGDMKDYKQVLLTLDLTPEQMKDVTEYLTNSWEQKLTEINPLSGRSLADIIKRYAPRDEDNIPEEHLASPEKIRNFTQEVHQHETEIRAYEREKRNNRGNADGVSAELAANGGKNVAEGKGRISGEVVEANSERGPNSVEITAASKSARRPSVGYRVPTGFEAPGTAADVIRHERDELGNSGFENISSDKMKELERYPSSAVTWVTFRPEHAERYGAKEEVEKLSLEGMEVLAEDGDGGYLVFKPNYRILRHPAGSTVDLLEHPLPRKGEEPENDLFSGPQALHKGVEIKGNKFPDLQKALNTWSMAVRGKSEPNVDGVVKDELSHWIKEHGGEGSGWYKKLTDDAIEQLLPVHPKLNDWAHATIFKALWAAHSYGKKPFENMDDAEQNLTNLEQGGMVQIEREDGQPWSHRSGTKFSLMKIQHLISSMGEQGAAEWLTTKHPWKEIVQKFEPAGLSVNKSKIVLDKNGETYGSMALGPKGGAFFLNLNQIPDYTTVDVWGTRALRRWEGRLGLKNTLGEDTITGNPKDTAPTAEEVKRYHDVISRIGKKLGLDNMDAQAIQWYYEHELYRVHGIGQEAQDYASAARRVVENRRAGIKGGKQGAISAFDFLAALRGGEHSNEPGRNAEAGGSAKKAGQLALAGGLS